MSIYSILKEGLRGEGSEKMWCTTKILSDYIDEYVPEKQREVLMNKIYYSSFGGHFDKEFADKTVEKFYYQGKDGKEHHAPYWTESELKPLYDRVRSKIPEYNFYDFVVAMNMIKSDNYLKLEKWFPGIDESEMVEKLVDETVNYLDDPDNPYGTEKVWKYLNS